MMHDPYLPFKIQRYNEYLGQWVQLASYGPKIGIYSTNEHADNLRKSHQGKFRVKYNKNVLWEDDKPKPKFLKLLILNHRLENLI